MKSRRRWLDIDVHPEEICWVILGFDRHQPFIVAAIGRARLGLALFADAREIHISAATSVLRISGPILDRIDINLDVPRVSVQKLAGLDGGEPSTSIHRRVEANWTSRGWP